MHAMVIEWEVKARLQRRPERNEGLPSGTRKRCTLGSWSLRVSI